MKTELKLKRHSILAGARVVELWYDGQLVGEITGADGRGIRLISKYLLEHPPAVTFSQPTPLIMEIKL